MNRFFAFILVGMLLFVGCGKTASDKVGSGAKASDEIDFGAVKNSTYTNKYFGLSVKFPPEWSVQDQESQKKIMELGERMVTQDDKNLQVALKAAELKMVTLFMVFQHPMGTPVSFNPNMTCIAERVSDLPGIKRGKDYLFHIKNILNSSPVKCTFSKDMTTEKFGGREFDMLHNEIPIAGSKVRQKIYVTIIKGYALVFTVSFMNDEEEAAMDNVMSTITFQREKT